MFSVTPQEALLWLAGLERECLEHVVRASSTDGPVDDCLKDCRGKCSGTGRVPVLDLREPHPDCISLNVGLTTDNKFCDVLFKHIYGDCKGTGWSPKQSETALHQAMNRAGYGLSLLWVGASRSVVFFWPQKGQQFSSADGEDDDWLAAAKAMKMAGYE